MLRRLADDRTTSVAVAGALGYFASLVLHELGHALPRGALGIPIVGIDLWFFGGLSQMRREPQTAGEELKVAAAGPAVTLALFGALPGSGQRCSPSSGSFTDVALPRQGFTTTPALALIGWLGFINAMLFVFNIVPAFPLDGGRIARAAIWWRTGDRNRATRRDRAHRPGVRACRSARSGCGASRRGGSLLGPDHDGARLLPLPGRRRRGRAGRARAAHQGHHGRRTSWTASPSRSRPDATLLDAQEQFFGRYRWPWFAVVDPARHFLGVVRQQRIESEIAAGRPALA